MEDHGNLLTTRNGFRFSVRPATPADDRTVADFFDHVSREDLRFRFLTAISVVGSRQVAELTHIDHHRAENFLAFTEDGSMMIATALLACDAAFDHGEVAVAIRSDHKHQGVGWELLAHVARYAEEIGVQTLESIESRDNRAAIELERGLGFTAEQYPGDPTLVLVSRKLDDNPKPPATASAQMEARNA